MAEIDPSSSDISASPTSQDIAQDISYADILPHSTCESEPRPCIDPNPMVALTNEHSKRTHAEISPQGRYIRFQEKLGSGQYKDVYRAYDTSEGIEVAWNTVNITVLPKEEKKRIMNEVRLLQNLEHKNLVQFHGSWVNREKEQVIFVTEIVVNGSLKDFINKVEVIRWKVIKRWARQILRGLEYLHTRDTPIIHRDLKCDNIFINGHTGDIRIGDLGLSTSCACTDKNMSVLGTPEFMAPELYDESYNEKVDIYAFGMCMLEMITKERPYSECANAAQIYKKVTQGIVPAGLLCIRLQSAVEFIKLCIDFDPRNRPSATKLLEHPFLADAREDEDNEEVVIGPLPSLARVGDNLVPAGPKECISISEVKTTELGDEAALSFGTRSCSCINSGLSTNDAEDRASVGTPAAILPHIVYCSSALVSPSLESPLSPDEMLKGQSIFGPFCFEPNIQSVNDDFDMASMPNSETCMRQLLLPDGRVERSEEDFRIFSDISTCNGQTFFKSMPNDMPTFHQLASTDAGLYTIGTRAISSNLQSVSVETAERDNNHTENVSVVPTQVQSTHNTLRLVMHASMEGLLQEIEFDFNLETDRARDVAAEMVRDLGIPEYESDRIRQVIENLSQQSQEDQILNEPSFPGNENGNLLLSFVDEEQLPHLSQENLRSSSDLKPIVDPLCDPQVVPAHDENESYWDMDGIEHCIAEFSSESSDSDDFDHDEDFTKEKEIYCKRLRQAQKAYESRQTNLMKAFEECQEENRRQQDKFRKDCEEFERKKQKMKAEFEIRVSEFEMELREFEDKHRRTRKHQQLEAKQGKLGF